MKHFQKDLIEMVEKTKEKTTRSEKYHIQIVSMKKEKPFYHSIIISDVHLGPGFQSR